MGSKNVAVERILTEGIWGDTRGHSNSLYKHANVQSKAVFSHAVTVMDRICRWIDEEKRVGPKFAACMWIYTKKKR